MGPFWGSFFDQFKTCGRERGFAAFCAAFGGMVALGILASFLKAAELDRYGGIVLALFALWTAAWLGIAIRRAWLARRDRLGVAKLSSDELRKARSKLKNDFIKTNQFPSVKPAERVPDTDLKY